MEPQVTLNEQKNQEVYFSHQFFSILMGSIAFVSY